MLKSYTDLTSRIRGCGRRSLSVGAAHDRDLLESVAQASKIAGFHPILFGDAKKIETILKDISYAGDCDVVDEKDDSASLAASVKCVHDGQASVLMKGQVNTSDFMRAVLDKAHGLRSGNLLSHLAAFEVGGFDRLLFVTDGGINIAPDLSEKKEILINALGALHRLGYDNPKVALLTANEQVNPKAPATVDAAEIANMWREGTFGSDCVVEGPIALDVALSAEAAAHKGIGSRIAGATDLFLVSNIEVGNVLGKSMANIAGAKMAGVVLGATAPIVLSSRAENAASKLNSILLACGCAA